jgi:hypothetical protein
MNRPLKSYQQPIAPLSPDEMHALWLLVPESRRVAFLGSLTEQASDRLLLYQLDWKTESKNAAICIRKDTQWHENAQNPKTHPKTTLTSFSTVCSRATCRQPSTLPSPNL